MLGWKSWFLACLFAPVVMGADTIAARRSILVLNESGMVGPFDSGVYDELRSKVRANSAQPVSFFLEQLELEHFGSERHERTLETYFASKYRDQSLGVILALGSSALDFMLRRREALWPAVPIVFVMVDEADLQRLVIPANVTGRTARVRFRDLVSAAHSVVPHLQRLAIVGDRWEIQTAFRHFQEEIPVAAAGLEIIDLVGLPLRELRKRVAGLPERTAIIYTSIFSDGEGTSYSPVDAVGFLAEAANRPIVIAAETFLGRGGIGGYLLTPAAVGEEAAELALRILNGEGASSIPITEGHVVKPMFDWRQLQRWAVPEAQLPEGSEIRFREPTAWQEYRWQIIAGLTALLVQGGMIIGLLFERHRRQAAEQESRRRILQVMHMNRASTAGALSASIGHELNQPLAAILSNAETAELLLSQDPLDLPLLREIVADIRRENRRASNIIKNLRTLLKKGSGFTAQTFDINESINAAIHILEPEAARRGIALSGQQRGVFLVRADPVHLQQVLLNLAANGMDAVSDCVPGRRRLLFETAWNGQSDVEVSVSDLGSGIPKEALKSIFESFYTTKENGSGLGLSIAQTIVETYGGKIWAENKKGGGAVFRFTLPLAKIPERPLPTERPIADLAWAGKEQP